MLRRDTNTDQIWVFVLHVEPDHKTNFTLDVKLLLNDRKFLRMSEGYNTTTGNNVPLNDPNISTLTQFQYGGQFPLLGVDKEDVPMELVLDFDYFVDEIGINIESVDGFFFGARYPDGFASTANFLQEFKLTDHRCDPSFSLSFPTPASLLYNQWDWFGIDYNRLNEAYSSSEIISSEIYSHCLTTIESGATVEFSDNAEILFYDGIIEIEPGATLELEDCHLRLMQGLNKIIVRGNLLFSGDPIFETEGGTLEIEYHNEEFPPIDYEINDATFEFNALNKLKIIGLEEPNLLVEESYIEHAIFDFSGDLTIQDLAIGSKNIVIDFSYGDLLVQNNSSLENTYVLASFPNGNGNSITIQNNEFANNEETNQKAVISIDDYKIFLIENNKIEINHCNGIELYHAGNNVGIDKSVSSNDIYSSTSNNECRGIDVFFSRADISNNYIYNNKYGVVAFGKSETAIMGNQNASSISGTQRFIDNIIHCYFSYSSYPEDIRYNYFEHNTTIDDPYVKLVYYDIMEDPEQPDYSVIYNIECNAWDSTFRPEFDLIPIGSYDYDPYWFIGQYCVKDGGEAGEIYDEAKVFIDSGYYSQADSNFKEIISDFPEDPHAIHSLRELYNIEEFNGNSFDSLRLYYRSVIQANQDSLLCRSADWMSMHCFIKMDSIQKAIDWLDSAINVPQNSVDSIFAIINLGYIYTHYPDTTLRSALFTIHNEHIPKSYRDYKVRREELFSSLLMSSTVGDENREISFDKNAAILQIVPNPTRDAINVKLQVLNEGYLKIDVYSAIGAKTREINLGKVQKGILDRSISLFNQPQGMFYIVVKHNNAVQDTEKVIKL
jgi:tetratricopeptide (TPR) repeat protein